jgi:hypothetical protein
MTVPSRFSIKNAPATRSATKIDLRAGVAGGASFVTELIHVPKCMVLSS